METIDREWSERDGADGDSGRVTVWQVRIGRVPLLLVNVIGVTLLLLGMLGVDVWFGPWWVWMALLLVNGWYVAGRVRDAVQEMSLDGVVSRRVYWRQERRRDLALRDQKEV